MIYDDLSSRSLRWGWQEDVISRSLNLLSKLVIFLSSSRRVLKCYFSFLQNLILLVKGSRRGVSSKRSCILTPTHPGNEVNQDFSCATLGWLSKGKQTYKYTCHVEPSAKLCWLTNLGNVIKTTNVQKNKLIKSHHQTNLTITQISPSKKTKNSQQPSRNLLQQAPAGGTAPSGGAKAPGRKA